VKTFGTAIVLAGGQSRRMGFDKQKIILNGHSLMYRNLNAVSAAFEQVCLSCNQPVLDYAGFDKLTIVPDRVAGIGPMAGIMAGLRCAESEFVYVLACDAVYDQRVVNALQHAIEEKLQQGVRPLLAIAEKESDYYEPFNGFYHIELLEKMVQAVERGCYALQPLLRRIQPKCVLNREEIYALGLQKIYLNFNTRCELKAYEG
jgi:molybdopterin-guanine dinucleotide biosynthesis protein A